MVSPPPETVGDRRAIAEAADMSIRTTPPTTATPTYRADLRQPRSSASCGSAVRSGNASSTMTSLTLADPGERGDRFGAARRVRHVRAVARAGARRLDADVRRGHRPAAPDPDRCSPVLSTVAVGAQAAFELSPVARLVLTLAGRLRPVDRRRRALGTAQRGRAAGPVRARPLGDEPVRRRHADRRLRRRRTVAPGNESPSERALAGDRSRRARDPGPPLRPARPRAPRGCPDRPRRDLARQPPLCCSDPHRPLLLALTIPNGLIVGCEALFVPYAGASAGWLLAAGAAGMMTGDLVVGRFLTRINAAIARTMRSGSSWPYRSSASLFDLPLAILCVSIALGSSGYAASLAQQEVLVDLTPAELRGQVLGLESALRMTTFGVVRDPGRHRSPTSPPQRRGSPSSPRFPAGLDSSSPAHCPCHEHEPAPDKVGRMAVVRLTGSLQTIWAARDPPGRRPGDRSR